MHATAETKQQVSSVVRMLASGPGGSAFESWYRTTNCLELIRSKLLAAYNTRSVRIWGVTTCILVDAYYRNIGRLTTLPDSTAAHCNTLTEMLFC
jgi:hypothetical protein